jgi:tetratricopeptide (TPR) repeat protein
MAGPVPLSEGDALYNSFVAVDRDDVAGMAQLLGRAQWIAKKRPSDFIVRVATAGAATYAGRRDVAVAELDAAFALRDIANPVAYQALGVLLMCIGDYERAGTVFHKLVAAYGPQNPSATANALYYGIVAGDTELIARILGDEALVQAARYCPSSEASFAALDILAQHDFAEHLADHQAVANSVLRDKQVRVNFTVVDDGSDTCMVTVRYYIVGDWALRSLLARQVHDRLCEMYEAKGLPSAAYVEILQQSILVMDGAAGAE